MRLNSKIGLGLLCVVKSYAIIKLCKLLFKVLYNYVILKVDIGLEILIFRCSNHFFLYFFQHLTFFTLYEGLCMRRNEKEVVGPDPRKIQRAYP